MARPVAARCISAPSGVAASSGSSAARTRAAVNSPITRRPRAEALGDHDGRGDAAVVAERDVPGGDAELRRRGRRRCRGPRGAAGRARRRSPRRRASAGRRGRRAPWPAPPWRRTARPATPVRGLPDGCLLGRREQPVAQPGRPVQRLGEARDRHDVDPDPDDHAASVCRGPGGHTARARLLDRDGLGEVARLVDVVPAGVGELAREDLQRHGREERREQRRASAAPGSGGRRTARRPRRPPRR